MYDSWTIVFSLFLVWILSCLAIIFIKSGECWRKAIVPVYNAYVLCKIVGKKWWIRYLLSLPFLIGVPMAIVRVGVLINDHFAIYNLKLFFIVSFIYDLIILYFIICTIIVYILIQIRLSKSFWKSNWFCVWMIFLPFVFAWILAFDSSTYDLKRLSLSENSKAKVKVKDKTVKN